MNCQNVVAEIAKQAGARLSSCEDYDPNICTFSIDPGDVTKIVIKSGQPFLKKSHYKIRSQVIRLHASDDFIQISMPYGFELEPMSINRADEIYSLKPVAEFRFGIKSYPVFTQRGALNDQQNAFLYHVAFQRFVGNLSMEKDDSIHVYGNGLRVYLHRPATNLVLQLIDSALAFLESLTLRHQELDVSSLPEVFGPLIPMIRLWGMTDETERDERRENISRVALRALVEEVRPYLPAIDSYLGSFSKEPLSEAGAALGTLAEFIVETELLLKQKG